jgi:hypothetical protein
MLPESVVRAIRFANEELMGLAFLSEKSAVVAARRAICGPCGAENKIVTPWGPHCKHCLCNIALKTRAEWTQCPLGKW